MWKNDYFKTVIAIILIVAIVLGFFFGSQLVLHTSYPALAVISPSMYITSNGNYYVGEDSRTGATLPTAHNLWISLSNPFTRTLDVGDMVIVEGITPKDLNTNYPNSDIIIFHSPENGELIVHRIIKEETINGTMYFQTKGDGNGNPWPEQPTSGQDPWDFSNPPGVPQNLVVGKVIMRIPWFGWITMIMQESSWGLPVVIALIMVLVIVEFVIPILREKTPKQENPTQT
jgi:signal peptidase I